MGEKGIRDLVHMIIAFLHEICLMYIKHIVICVLLNLTNTSRIEIKGRPRFVQLF